MESVNQMLPSESESSIWDAPSRAADMAARLQVELINPANEELIQLKATHEHALVDTQSRFEKRSGEVEQERTAAEKLANEQF
jgi:hypothetical protein